MVKLISKERNNSSFTKKKSLVGLTPVAITFQAALKQLNLKSLNEINLLNLFMIRVRWTLRLSFNAC